MARLTTFREDIAILDAVDMDDFLARLFNNQWAFGLAATTVLLALAEAGHRVGHRLNVTNDEARRHQVVIVQNAVLALLGLLLGFTFSMAVARYDTRRALVMKEANVIETAWLGAGLLSDAHRQPIRDLLREYIDVRLRAQAELHDHVQLAGELRRSEEIQSLLWQHAEGAAAEAPTPITATFVQTVTDLIDTDGERVEGWRNRIPPGVWLILLVVASVGCFTSAYVSGAFAVRSPFTSLVLPLLVSVVMLLIFDMTHERQGFIGMSQQSMIDLRRAIHSENGSSDRSHPH
jgi:hypothetical protein